MTFRSKRGPVAAGFLRLKRLLLLVSTFAAVPGAPALCRAGIFLSRRHLEGKVAAKLLGFYLLRTGAVLPLLAAF